MQKAVELDMRRNSCFRQKSYYIKTITLIILMMVLSDTYRRLPDPKLMRGFDPYDVIGVSTSTSFQDIRKTFRRRTMSFPDKYIGDYVKEKEQETNFTMLYNAYECLKDPIKMPNCRNYGSPDVPQAYKIIKFPFVSEEQIVMIFILFVLLVLILVYRWISNQGKLNRNNILNSNNKLIFEHVQQNKLINYQSCLDLISQCHEVKDTDFLNKLKVEHAPGILYTAVDIAISLLKASQEIQKNQQNYDRNQFLSPDQYQRQVEVCLNAIPKIIQNQSKCSYPGVPQLDVRLGFDISESQQNWEALDIYSIYKLEVKLSGLVDEFIASETFSALKLNVWNIILIHNEIIVDLIYVLENKREITLKYKFVPASLDEREISQFKFQVIALSDSYPIKLEQEIILLSKLPVQQMGYNKFKDYELESD